MVDCRGRGVNRLLRRRRAGLTLNDDDEQANDGETEHDENHGGDVHHLTLPQGCDKQRATPMIKLT